MNEKSPRATTEHDEVHEHTPTTRTVLSRRARFTAQRAIAAYSQLEHIFRRGPIYIDDDEPTSTISDETYAALQAAAFKADR